MHFFRRFMIYPQSLSLKTRLLSLVLVTVGYIALFLLLYPLPFGTSFTALAILPVAVAAILFNIRGGLLAGASITALNLLLIRLVDPNGVLDWLVGRGPGEALGLIVVGLLFGHIGRLQIRLQQQITEQQQIQEALRASQSAQRESEALYKPLFENHHTVMLLIDPATSIIVDVNQAACDFYGYTREEMQGMAVGQINQLPNRPLREALNVASGSPHSHFFFHHRLSSGEIRDVEVFTTRIHLADRALLYSIIHDITENNRIMQAEREQRVLAEALRDTAAVLSSTLEPDEVLRRILDNTSHVVPHDGANIHLIDSDHTIIQIARGSGYGAEVFSQKDPILGASLFDIPSFKWMAENRCPMVIRDTREYDGWINSAVASWIRSYLGAPMYARGELVGFLNLDSRTPGFFDESFVERLQAFVDQAAVAIDNAHLVAALQQQAVTDEVTRSYNRRGLAELGLREFDRALRFHRSLSAVMLDIDHFKQVNDTFGHLTGDQVLRILTERCRASIREVDVLGRYGGEEFLIFLVENDLQTAAQVAERLRLYVAQHPFETSAGHIPITVSIGVAALTSDTPNLQALIQRADQALYKAKAQGRNQIALSE